MLILLTSEVSCFFRKLFIIEVSEVRNFSQTAIRRIKTSALLTRVFEIFIKHLTNVIKHLITKHFKTVERYPLTFLLNLRTPYPEIVRLLPV